MMEVVVVGKQQTSGKWLFLSLVLAVLGIIVSAYSIHHHLEVHANGHTDAVCNINATVNCDAVAMSKYSEVAGVPLGVFGLGYFVACLVLLGTKLIGHKSEDEHMHGYAALVLIGVAVSVVLGGISVGVLGAYCLTCITTYVLTLLQLGVLGLGRRDLIPPGFSMKNAVNGGTTAAIAVAVVVAAFNFFKPTHSPSAETASNPANPGQPQTQLLPNAADIPLSKSAYQGLGEDYRAGGDNATVVLQEFADFECPACGQMATRVEQLHKEFGDKLLVVFRNYPLDQSCNEAIRQPMHKYACKAAIMARCAGQYGKFWQYFDLAYANQTKMNNDTIKDWAKQVGLTQEQINTCWDSKDLLAKVKDDIALGNKLGIDSTPTLYINGHKVVGGRSLDDLRADINEQMK